MQGQFSIRRFFVGAMTLGWNSLLLQVSQTSQRNRVHIADSKVNGEPKRNGVVHAGIGRKNACTAWHVSSNTSVGRFAAEHDHDA
jgi:hypothetical protein